MRRALIALVVLAVLLIVAIGGWVAWASYARAKRETVPVERIAVRIARWVPTPDATIHTQRWGARDEAPIVVLVHGTGAWSGTWFGLPDALVAAGWRVVALDLPPFGLSTTRAGPATDYTRAAQARRILAVVEALGRPVVLVGHSFGSGPALEAAMIGGDAVRRLVLVDPALGLDAQGRLPHCAGDEGLPGPLRERHVRTAVLSATVVAPVFTSTLLKRFVARKEVVTSALVPAYQKPFAKPGFTAGLGDWAETFARGACERAASLDADALARWRPARAPALIWGEADTITPLPQAAGIRASIAGTSLTVVPGVGHIPHIEDPKRFAETLVGVLSADLQ